jgi:hypothetical protein
MGRGSAERGGAARSLIAAAVLATSLVGDHDLADAGGTPDKAIIRFTISELAPGAAYTGTCRLTDADGPDKVIIEGAEARTYEFSATSLRCEIDAAGGLTVMLEKAGSRSRTSTSGGRVVISIS